VIGSAALATSLLAAQVLSAGTANAYDGPNGHHQWVQISTDGAPTWAAEMELYAAGQGYIYKWSHGKGSIPTTGGGQTWWFTANQSDFVEVWVDADEGIKDNKLDMIFNFGPGEADGHCFHINAVGKLKYTGDSNTGGCTPD
jgi:hypothetical protein